MSLNSCCGVVLTRNSAHANLSDLQRPIIYGTNSTMIDTITVPLAEFDLQGFIDAYRDFYRSRAGDEIDPDGSVL